MTKYPNTLISIIIPIYNVESYLPACIDSIQKQTHTKLQIILVDDGSTDHSGKICDEYATKDNRIEVIHQPNAGVSVARNNGMRIAKGEYIAFVDGDDYIHHQMYEVLLTSLAESTYDFAMILGKQVTDDHIQEFPPIKKPLTQFVITQKAAIQGLFNYSSGTGLEEIQLQVVWNKLYKSTLLKGEFFSSTGTEDTEFNCRIYQKSYQAILIKEDLYYWVQRATSITHQKINRNYIDRANSYYLCLQNIPNNKLSYQGYCLEKLYKTMVNIRYHAQHTTYKDLANQTITKLKDKTFHQFIKNKHISLIKKIGLVSFYNFPFLYDGFMWLCNINSQIQQLKHHRI